jgi:2-C-methyl-D-erythritol 2,4-cyclodiphosphate synthase
VIEVADAERNLDCTLFCAAPRIGPVVSEMRSNIAAGLDCSPDRINVKGKTNDGFGPEGQGEAISATVVVQLRLRDNRRPPA